MGVSQPVVVVEDHDCGHAARGDHEHDGGEVCPCQIICNDMQMIYRHWKVKCTVSALVQHRPAVWLHCTVFFISFSFCKCFG